MKFLNFFLFKFFFIFYLKFIVKLLFYFNSNYEKSPYIKNPERKLKKSRFSWEKVWEVRNAKVSHNNTHPLDFELLYSREEFIEVEARVRRHEVLDFPIVWQPEIVDEKDDWRYRRSPYLKRGVLRIVLFSKWELENLNDVQKGLQLFRFFGPLILIPLVSSWLYCNRMEIIHFAISCILLNKFLINNIGFEKDTVYSALVRLYYTNYINQAVQFLLITADNLENRIAHAGWVYNISSYKSENRIKIKRGVHNFLVVNKMTTEVAHLYDENDKLSIFICKEILIDFTAIQKIKIKQAENYLAQNVNIIDKAKNFIFGERCDYSAIPIPFTKLRIPFLGHPAMHFDRFGGAADGLNDIKKGLTYDPNNEFTVWVFENAIVPGESWRPFLWWRYDFCGGNLGHKMVSMGNIPTIIEGIRGINYSYVYPSDIIVFIAKKIYKMIKPENDSFFWTFTSYIDKYFFRYLRKLFNKVVDRFNLWTNNRSALLLNTAVEKYNEFIKGKNRFVTSFKNSKLGYYWWYFEEKPSFWKWEKSKKKKL